MKGSKESPCHTCRRQRLRCDATKPTCNKCATRGVECLGYGAQPILWVLPQTYAPAASGGKDPACDATPNDRGDGSSSSSSSTKDLPFTVATAKRRGRPRLVLMTQEAKAKPTDMRIQQKKHIRKGNASGGKIWLPRSPNLNPPGYEADRLAIHCINYYNDNICPDLVLIDNPDNPHRLPVEYWAYFPEMILDMIISAALTTQVIRSKAGTGLLIYRATINNDKNLKRHHLGAVDHPSMPIIYKHQRSTLKSLNAELMSPQAKDNDTVLTLIVTLMRCEIQQSAFGAWPAHLEAAGTIVAHRGGFTALAESKRGNLDFILSEFMLYARNLQQSTDGLPFVLLTIRRVDVMSTTMTPTTLLEARTVKQLEYIPQLPILYRDGLESGFPCPNELVECLIRINYARFLSSVSFADSSHTHGLAEELICNIASFSPKAWAGKQYRDNTKRPTVSSPSQFSSDSETTIIGGNGPPAGIADATATLSLITSSSALSSGLAGDLRERWEDLAKAFQATVLLYCLQTLFPFPEMQLRIPRIMDALDTKHESSSVIINAATLRNHMLKMLLGAIHRLWDIESKDPASWCGKFLMWPMFVAGMELDSYPELPEERPFLCSSLSKLCDHLGDLSPLDAVAMLEATYSRSKRAAAMGHIQYGSWVDQMIWTEAKGLFFL